MVQPEKNLNPLDWFTHW